MNPKRLIPLLAYLGPEDPSDETGDFAARIVRIHGHVHEVEFCAGDGQFSAALLSSGYRGKALDVTWRIMWCVPM